MSSPLLSILIPAAGSSQRLGQPKQLVTYQGKTLIQKVVNCALTVTPHELIVVTGANSEGVQEVLHKSPARLIYNPKWSAGMGRSIALGAVAVDKKCDGLMILLCDQWRIQPQDLSDLVNAWQSKPGHIICAQAKAYRGPPVIFPAKFLGELGRLKGTDGAQSILQAHQDLLTSVTIENAKWDLDTTTQLNKLKDTQ